VEPTDLQYTGDTQDELYDNAIAYLARVAAAVNAGLAPADHYLGIVYAEGLSNRKDPVLAYVFFEIAWTFGRPLAWWARQRTVAKLSLLELAHARELAAAWLKEFHVKNGLDWTEDEQEQGVTGGYLARRRN
jgi:TPR repeat protein